MESPIKPLSKEFKLWTIQLLCWVKYKQCDHKKSPNVYKSWPKMISVEKLKILTSFQKLPKKVGDLGKLIVAKGFKNCPKTNKSPNLVTLNII